MARSQFPRLGDVFLSPIGVAWLFLLPALLFLTIFVFLPILYLVYLSFTTGSFSQEGVRWVGLQNYQQLLLSPDFWQVIGNTLYFTGATVLPTIVLPLLLAVGLNQGIRGRDLLRTAYFLPTMTSIVAAGLGFRWLFQTDGPVNQLVQTLGGQPIAWLSDPTWAMPVLILLSSWKQLGFNLVVFLAGLQTIPRDRYEAALLDGANAWQQFRYITLPGLRPTLILVFVTTTIFTLRSFEQVYVVTGGGPLDTTNLLVFYIYQQAFALFDFGYAAAAATVLLGVTFGLIWLQLRTRQDPNL
ncbi:sugar ABC transporter permease [Thermosynechococcus sp. CL-1]|uniref:carbohydrate ABC transporter permease n=1 Tax=unclassified Thermosynechococcus TaxID=2622553 RepID=UPI00122E0553|nr:MULTISPECIES: sugar ABC transporter permease [unclassified Thermosynechococcus]QEQ01661.1 sugar ABC transporter permease [Thermosynechococcus sp. CL-1]WNC64842.1 sugar ABC transporter permease [Thermosynechococcus sp. HY593]